MGSDVESIWTDIPGDWRVTALSDLCKFQNGYGFKSSSYDPVSQTTYEVLRMGHIVPGGGLRRPSSEKHIERAKCESLGRFVLNEGDLVMSMTDMKSSMNLLGHTARVDESDRYILNQRVGRITVEEQTQLDARFLYFVSNTRDVIQWLRARANSGVQVNLSTAVIKQTPIPVPPLPEQRRIASVLGALDDKIELNRKMNRTLEEMAQALFKSWFIDFDGHDDLVPSELGPIPRGWAATSLGEVVEIHDKLRVPLSKMQRSERQGPYPYHGATSVMDYVDDYLFDGIYVLLGEDGSVVDDKDRPVLQYVWGKFWVNNHAHILLPKPPVGIEHLLCALRTVNIRPFMTGAVQAKVNQRNLKKVPFILPPAGDCQRFTDATAPLYSRLRQLTAESRTLAQLRDTLLPKLISGEIRVPEAEHAVEAAL